MFKSVAIALVASAATLAAGAAQAGGVSWSIGINTPIVGTVISNAPSYGPGVYAPVPRVYVPVPAPVFYAAPPDYYAPSPAYYAPPPAYYPYPRAATYYRPLPVVYPRYAPVWRHEHGHDQGRRDDRWEGHRGHRD